MGYGEMTGTIHLGWRAWVADALASHFVKKFSSCAKAVEAARSERVQNRKWNL
jgi:poly-D-alanine transfer protein DltD